jgi:hypothetical protein
MKNSSRLIITQLVPYSLLDAKRDGQGAGIREEGKVETPWRRTKHSRLSVVARGLRKSRGQVGLITLFLIFVSLFQMTGDLFNQTWMKALGAAWGASPAPKVFSSAEGLETFSSEFFLIWTDRENISHRVQLTPQLAKNLKGPYNRRNVYGAVLSYGPVLSKNKRMCEAYESILEYAISQNGPLLGELGIPRESISEGIIIEVVPKKGKDYSHLELIKEVSVGTHEK